MKTSKGIILAGGSGSRLKPLTDIKNKHTFLIYDKPMIYYPLSVLMLMDISDIQIISNDKTISDFKKLLGNGSKFGINLSYKKQKRPNGIAEAFKISKEFLRNSNKNVLILGDNFFYGCEIQQTLSNINLNNEGCSILLYSVHNPYEFGNVVLNKKEEIVKIREKMKNNKNNFAITGIYFFDKDVVNKIKEIKPSKRGELEITDLINLYLKEKKLKYKVLGRGNIWFDMGTVESINEVNSLIPAIQKRNNLAIANIHEIAFIKKLISRKHLGKLVKNFDSPYYNYIKNKYF
jgi:glucose-1-phosphate thymidylyltransferase